MLPYQPEHFALLQLQKAQHWCLPWMSEDTVAWLAELDAYTIQHEEEVIAIAGLWTKWPGSAVAWSYIADAAGPHMTALTRVVLRFLELKAPRRVEAYVDEEFEAGHRWMALLGFEREGLLRAFKPDGGGQYIYSRIRHG